MHVLTLIVLSDDPLNNKLPTDTSAQTGPCNSTQNTSPYTHLLTKTHYNIYYTACIQYNYVYTVCHTTLHTDMHMSVHLQTRMNTHTHTPTHTHSVPYGQQMYPCTESCVAENLLLHLQITVTIRHIIAHNLPLLGLVIGTAHVSNTSTRLDNSANEYCNCLISYKHECIMVSNLILLICP